MSATRTADWLREALWGRRIVSRSTLPPLLRS
jgi:hypothetical protein